MFKCPPILTELFITLISDCALIDTCLLYLTPYYFPRKCLSDCNRPLLHICVFSLLLNRAPTAALTFLTVIFAQPKSSLTTLSFLFASSPGKLHQFSMPAACVCLVKVNPCHFCKGVSLTSKVRVRAEVSKLWPGGQIQPSWGLMWIFGGRELL